MAGRGATRRTRHDFQIPSTLAWSGQPAVDWNAKTQSFKAGDKCFNGGLHVKTVDGGTDAGVASATARTRRTTQGAYGLLFGQEPAKVERGAHVTRR